MTLNSLHTADYYMYHISVHIDARLVVQNAKVPLLGWIEKIVVTNKCHDTLPVDHYFHGWI